MTIGIAWFRGCGHIVGIHVVNKRSDRDFSLWRICREGPNIVNVIIPDFKTQRCTRGLSQGKCGSRPLGMERHHIRGPLALQYDVLRVDFSVFACKLIGSEFHDDILVSIVSFTLSN